MAYIGEMQYLTIGDSTYSLPTGGGGGGSVTSVGVSNATNGGLTVGGDNPITSTGTITIGHSNVLTSAQTTSGVYPIKIDKNGHISEYGSAVTIPSITLNGSSTTSPSFYAPISAGTSGYVLKSNGSGAPSWTSAVLTDENLKWTASTSSNTYYPLVSTSTATTSTANTLNGIDFYQYYNTVGGYRRLDLGNSTAYKSTGGAYGTIRLYGAAATYYGDLVPGVLGTTSGDGHISANRIWTLPDKTGTIALTSDIPTVPAIMLNGSSSTTPSFYAPTGAGTNGQYLKSNGSGAPTWASITIPSITLNGSSTTSPSFYAPTSVGTSGYVLKSNGSGAPTWTSAVLTDENLKVSAISSSTSVYYPVLTAETTSAENKKYTVLLKAYYNDTNYNIYNLAIGNGVGVAGNLLLGNTGSSGNYTRLQTSGTTSRTITLPNATGTVALTSDIVDEKVATAEITSGTMYFPVLGTNTTAAETKYKNSMGFSYTPTLGSNIVSPSTSGTAILQLGTNTSSSANGSMHGVLRLYSQSSAYVDLKASASYAMANRTITLPNKTGTVALTDDVTKVQIVRW